MNKTQYRQYLSSAEWLIKKAELINIYKNEHWNINCYCCGSTNNLQVHHFSYKHIGNEILSDERIWDLTFMCNDCHKKWHFDKDFKNKIEESKLQTFFRGLSKMYGKTKIR